MAQRTKTVPRSTLDRIDSAVTAFDSVRTRLDPTAAGLVEQLKVAEGLAEYIHFIKYRIKDSDHLREKLIRKAKLDLAADREFSITDRNVFSKITDLIGIRILHLHSQQFPRMHDALLAFFGEQRLKVVGKPFAICWDSEYQQFYREVGLSVRVDSSMYTSVHYVVELNQAAKYRCEVQVRTLMDEVWGEVSHTVNYPTSSPSDICGDQLRVLARLTSGCVRLVDSIFKTDSQARE